MNDGIIIQLGVPAQHVEVATDLYCDAFREKLTPFLGEPERAARFLATGLAPDRAFLALQNGKVVGIAGFKVDSRGLYEPGVGRFFKEYGWSAPARIFGLLLLERAESQDLLLMDGIAVSESVRGRGIGTRLLEAIEDHAQRLNKRSIRLDVIDTNPGARRLYERFGFEARETKSIGPLKLLFSFGGSTEMRKQVSEPS
ncbi:MAG: GNAT family N-acetyltransferase [Alphaproteobacteria bacterium]|nr:GNAT family N-acetyltransferase [Alphaproteobacteria bacterium]